MAIITNQEWEAQFEKQPQDLSAVTKIVCTHPVHKTREFYLTANQWQDNIKALLAPYWVNDYTVVMIPCH